MKKNNLKESNLKTEESKDETLEELTEEESEDKKENDEVIEQETVVPENQKIDKKNTVFMTICASVLIAFIVLGIASITIYDKKMGPNKPKEKTKKAEVENKSTASYRLSGNGLEDFDLYFLQLENKQANVIYSPLSIKYALAMLNEGTAGDSHEQILNIIGDYKANRYYNNEHMSFANAMFIRNTFQENMNEKYVSSIQEKYGAESIMDPFESASNVNSWVSNKTFNLINNLLDDETVRQDNFIIVNALAIDMNWNNQLQCNSGSKIPCMKYYVYYPHEEYVESVPTLYGEFRKFKFEDSEIKSPEIGASINKYDIITELGEENIRKEVGKELQEYIDNGGEMCGETYESWMNQYIKDLASSYKRVDQSTDFYYYTDTNVKVFAKDLQTYDNMTLQYVGIMPKSDTLQTYIKNVNANDLNMIVKNLKSIDLDSAKDGVVTKIYGNIPLFKYEYKLDLINDLKKLGIEDVFNIEKADLSPMLNGEKQFISDATHKAMIEFSNDGIKAAASSAMGGAGSSSCYIPFDHKYEVPIEEVDLSFDKPYMYIIRDKSTGEVWFTGTVYNPEV